MKGGGKAGLKFSTSHPSHSAEQWLEDGGEDDDAATR